MFLSGTISFSATTLELDQKRNISAPLNVTDYRTAPQEKLFSKRVCVKTKKKARKAGLSSSADQLIWQ